MIFPTALAVIRARAHRHPKTRRSAHEQNQRRSHRRSFPIVLFLCLPGVPDPRRLALTIAAALSQTWVPAHAQTPTVLTSGDVGPAAHTPNPSASWTLNNLLYIGNTGVGTMSITDGGTVTNTGRGSIGESTRPSGP